jgi:hypothetical protein
LRLFDQEYLVGTNAQAAVADEAPLLGRQVDRLIDAIDHDKIVTGAMHLGEFDFHAAIIKRTLPKVSAATS